MLNHHHLWSLDGLTSAHVLALIGSAQALKKAAQAEGVPQLLKGKNLALLSDDHYVATACAPAHDHLAPVAGTFWGAPGVTSTMETSVVVARA